MSSPPTTTNMPQSTSNNEHKPVGLLTIPPELRLETYPYLLTGQHDFQLWPKQRFVIDKTGKRSARTKTCLTHKPDAPSPGISTSILLTCKLIYQEASPLLYTSNKFSSHGANIPRFMSQIGSNVQLLRHIELKGVRAGQEMTQVFDALEQATSLSKLVIGFDVGIYGDNAESLVKHLTSVVRSWMRTRRVAATVGANDFERVLNVIEIGSKEQQRAKEIEEKVRKAIWEEMKKDHRESASSAKARTYSRHCCW